MSDFTRGRILGGIETQPGISFNELRRNLKLPNGTAVYHLEVLERERLIKSERDGIYRRFFPWGMPVEKDGFYPSAVQKRIMDAINNHQTTGIRFTQIELAKELRMSKQLLGYHIKKLRKEGVVKKLKGRGLVLSE